MPRASHLALAVVVTGLLAPLGWAAPAEGLATDFHVVLEITTAVAGAKKMFEAFDTASLNLYDFDGDGQMEIVANNDNNRVYVLDSKTGKALAELETYHYDKVPWPTRELNPIAIGELYGDGVPCLVVPNSASYLSAFCFDATASSWDSFAFVKKWEVRVDAALYEPDFQAKHAFLYHPGNGTQKEFAGMDGHPYLADVDGDGTLEVFVETDSWPGQLSFTHEGKYRWSRSFADGNAGAIVRDIDADGAKEAVFFSDAGLVTAYTARTGGIEWTFDARKHNATPGSIPVPGLVADLNGDGKYETIFGARQAVQTSDPDWINQSHARYFALDDRGRMLWNASYDWMNPLQYNHPAPADVNGDGVLDIVLLDWNTVGHKPGNWNTTNRKSNLFALDGRDGSALWHRGVTVYWSNKDIVIIDVDGDGDLEIVAPTAKYAQEGLGIYDLGDGTFVGWAPVGDGWQLTRGPVAGDLYGDGRIELVVPFHQAAPGENYRQVDVGWREGKLVILATGAKPKAGSFTANFLHNDEIDTGAKGTSGKPLTRPFDGPPIAKITLNARDLTVTVDGSGSTDPEGRSLRFDWAWGDGTSGQGPGLEHTYREPGSYNITLTVTDERGATSVAGQTISIVKPPPTSTSTPTPDPEPTPTPDPAPTPTPDPGPTPTPGPTPSPATPRPAPEESRIPGGGIAVAIVALLAAVGSRAVSVRRRSPAQADGRTSSARPRRAR